jgi:hypothetical protein
MTTPRTPNPLLSLLGRLLQSALNRALALDPDTRSQLQRLDGRALSVTFTNTPLALRLAVSGDRLEVGPAFGGDSARCAAATMRRSRRARSRSPATRNSHGVWKRSRAATAPISKKPSRACSAT